MIAWLVEWYDPERTRFDKDEIRNAILSVILSGTINEED